MRLRDLLYTRTNDLRVVWRILLFLVIGLLLSVLFVLPLQAVGATTEFGARVLVLVAVLIASYLLTRFVNRKPLAAIGFQVHPASFRELGVGVLLGFLAMAGIFLVLYFAGKAELFWTGVSPAGASWVVAEAVVFFAAAALFEELLFRGYPFQTLMQGVTFLPAATLVSAAFALAHWFNPNATTLSLLNICLAGYLFSFAYLVTRGLWLPFGIHFGWNFSQSVLFGFPTSGLHFDRYELFRSVTGEPAWLTGGAFGPEGGILATAALAGLLWFVLKAGWLKAPPGIVTLDSVEDLLPRRDAEAG